MVNISCDQWTPMSKVPLPHAADDDKKKHPTKLAEQLSAVYSSWDPNESLVEFTHHRLTQFTTRKQQYNSRDPWDTVVLDCLQAVVNRADQGVLVAERAEMLSYLLSLHQEILLHPHDFVIQGQLHLLQWAMQAGHVDLKRLISTCPSLVEHVHTLPWLTLEIKRKNKPRGIPGDLTVAEVLCALAAGYGEFFIFQWLLEEVIPPARHTVTFNHRDLLYLAAIQNSLVIVKYLLAHRPIDALQIIPSLEASVAANAYLSAITLLDHFKAENTSPELRTELMVIGARSKWEDLRTYANVESMREVCAALQQQLESAIPTDTIVQYFDTHFNVSTDLGWNLTTLGRYVEFSADHILDRTAYCVYIEKARSIEELLACLLTLSIRTENLAFFEHILNTLVTVLNREMANNTIYAARAKSSVFMVDAVTVLCATLSERLALYKPYGSPDRKEFFELKSLFEDGAAVDVLEECLQRQATALLSIPVEEHAHLNMSLAYLVATDFCDCAELASQGHLHIIRYVLENKQVRISVRNVEKAVDSAACAGQLEVLQYLLQQVYDTPSASPFMLPVQKQDLSIQLSEVKSVVFADFSARVAYQVRGLLETVSATFTFENRNPLLFNNPCIVIMEYVLDYALARGYFSSADPENCFLTLSLMMDSYQLSGHQELFTFVRRMCTKSVFQSALNYKDTLLHSLVSRTWTGAIALTLVVPDEAALYLERSLTLIDFLLDVGVAVKSCMELIISECASIFTNAPLSVWVEIVQRLFANGVDLQRVVFVVYAPSDAEAVQAATHLLEELKAAQRKQWKVCDAIAAGRSLLTLQSLLQETRERPQQKLNDRNGSDVMQVAALHDRGDVILWLHREHQMDIPAVNREGLNVLQLCRRAGSLHAAKIVADAIGGDSVRAFCYRHFHRRRALRTARVAQQVRVASAIQMQRWVRGWSVRCKYAPLLREVKGSWESFLGKWGAVIAALQEIRQQRRVPFSWAEQKFRYDMAVDVREQDVELQRSLDQVSSTMQAESGGMKSLEFSKLGMDNIASSAALPDHADPVDAVELSQAVVRWLDKADEMYRAMFHKKVARLAQGSRSYALSKRLKGCEYPICESKLDAGQRILWTYISRDNKQHVLIWFVAKHDNVSRLARLIDNACARTFRSLNEANIANCNQLSHLTEDSVLLDPSRNVPMKIYIAQRSELPLLAEKAWKAPLRLNQREQGVRSQTGTVLLLGRSGTGKTLCVMDRMNHDRAASLLQAGVTPFKQLFVTRSSALCDFVRLHQQHYCTADDLLYTEYSTFDNFLCKLERDTIGKMAGESYSGVGKYVNFQLFRDIVYPLLNIKPTRTLDALVAWTQIRSFLKGSIIEAALEGGVLSLPTYLDTSKFSRDRCRLLPEQRQEIYALFVQYQALHELHGWWDDMDRTMKLLRHNLPTLQHVKDKGDCDNKIYVDEVQDNTQVEIALYLVAVGGRVDALFLAGDPAQSVVEGVEFRFEEVRSLVYVLRQQQEALQRPTKLLVNYRSHSGILNCAGAVLGRMLAMFPGAAKTLPADEGLFLGPRPAFYNAQSDLADVRKLLTENERFVVLCPDERAADLSAQLSSGSTSAPNLVLGIRAAKGLEFTDIVLLDFFGALPDSDYKAWKELLAVNGKGLKKNNAIELQQYAFPQLEPQLKLLYTGITRCINRLIFVESRRSRIGGLFFRWLKQHGLADAFSFPVGLEANGESQQLMTRDEWRMRGIDIALSAEGAGDLAHASRLLSQAAQCFERADEISLKAVIVIQMALLSVTTNYSAAIFNNKAPSDGTKHEVHTLSAAEGVAVASTVLRGLLVGLNRDSVHLCRAVESILDPQSRKFFVSEVLLTSKIMNIA